VEALEITTIDFAIDAPAGTMTATVIAANV